MAYCYVVSFVHPDTRTRLRYYGAAEGDWLAHTSPRVRELADWFGAEEFSVDRRREFGTLAEAHAWARRLSMRARLHLRSDWLNGMDYQAPVLTGDHVDRRGRHNPMFGKRHDEASRRAMAEAKRGRRWVYRGAETKQVPPEALEGFLRAGWKAGRPPTKGRQGA